jgi:hypothetical protein
MSPPAVLSLVITVVVAFVWPRRSVKAPNS